MPVFERKIGRLSIVGRTGRRIAFTAQVDKNLTGATVEAAAFSLVGREVVMQATVTVLGYSGGHSSALVEFPAEDVARLGVGTFGWRMEATIPGCAERDLLAGTLEIKP
jgi:hypothetical protein